MKKLVKSNNISLVNAYEILNIIGIKKEIIFPSDLRLSDSDKSSMEKHLLTSVKKFINGKLSFNFLRNEFFPECNIYPTGEDYEKIKIYILRKNIK